MFHTARPLEIGKEYRGEVTNFLSLDKFYVRLGDEKAEATEAELIRLLRRYRGEIERGEVSCDQVWEDTLAVVVFDGWRIERAEIYRNTTSQSHKLVYFVDRGRIELVESVHIYPSCLLLLRLPALAIPCSTLRVTGRYMEHFISGMVKIRVVGKWDGAWVSDVETSEGDFLILKLVTSKKGKVKLPTLPKVPGTGYESYDYISWSEFKIPVRVLEVLSATELIVQLNIEAASFVAETIAELKDTRQLVFQTKLTAGKPCLALYKGKYCRGTIIQCTPVGTSRVQLVDYCKSVVVQPNDIAELPEELSQVPRTGVKVLIGDLVGVTITADQLMHLKSLLDGKDVYGTIVSTIYKVNGIKRVVITVAVPECKDDFRGVPISELLSTPPVNLKKTSTDDEEVIGVEEAGSFLFPSAPEGSCRVTLLKDHLAQIVSNRLEALTKEMNSFYNVYNQMTTPVLPGNHIAVMDGEGNWRRGVILEFGENKTVIVKLIDVGKITAVGREKLRNLLSYFGRISQMCYQVYLTRTLEKSLIQDFCFKSNVYVNFSNGFMTITKVGGDSMGPLKLM